MKEFMNRPSRKLLMLIPHLYRGGAEKVYYDLAEMLSKYYQVDECIFSKSKKEVVYKSDNILFELDEKRLTGSISRFLFRCKKLSAIVKKQNSLVCISHMEGP